MASKAATLGDPRRPQEVKKYSRVSDTDEPPSALTMVGLMIAMFSMLLRMKLLAWLAIFVCMAAITHLPTDTSDYKQVMMTITFAGMGLINTYIMPTHRAMPAPAPAAAAS